MWITNNDHQRLSSTNGYIEALWVAKKSKVMYNIGVNIPFVRSHLEIDLRKAILSLDMKYIYQFYSTILRPLMFGKI